MNSVIHRLFEKKACAIVGYLTLVQLGIERNLSPKTVKTYKDDIDLAYLDICLNFDENTIQHLDLFSGLQKCSSEPENQKGVPVISDENSE
jgi:hypothetical protein